MIFELDCDVLDCEYNEYGECICDHVHLLRSEKDDMLLICTQYSAKEVID